MQLLDLFLTPLYIALVIFLASLIKPYVTNTETRKYFYPALSLKLFGAVALGLIYTFYYSGGDTINFFNDAIKLSDGISKDFEAGIKVLFRLDDQMDDRFMRIRSSLWYYKDPPSYFVVQFATILSFVAFKSYGATAVLFGTFSFSGVWMMYYTFCFLKNHLYKSFAYTILFLPSMFFWGSGILKDSITIGALGWLFWATYQLISNKYSPLVLLSIFISGFILIKVKIYILMCFLPVAIYWFFLEKTNFSNKNIKYIVRPFALILGISFAILGIQRVASTSDKYNLEQITETVTVTSQWLSHVSNLEGGSGYQLSEPFDGSFGSFARLAPQAFNVTYFRPYIWESGNPVMILSAVESLLFFITFVWAIFLILKSGFKLLFQLDSFVIVGFIFAAFFGIAVGISTYNFGSLVRYKIPSMPFLIVSLISIIDMRSDFFKKL